MHKTSSNTSERSIGMQDILFILCKHKWMILIFLLLGLGAATAVFMAKQATYESQAKLLVRYVLERSAVDPYQSQQDQGVRSAGADVIGTEIEILGSADLATEVASAIGIEKLLPDFKGHATPSEASRVILANLEVGTGQSGNVLHVKYKNADPQMAKEVLRELVERYFNKHLEIHRSAAAFDMVSKQVDEVRGRLEKTEKELNRLRTESGIVSMMDATKNLSAQRGKIQQDLMQARAEMAQQAASIQALEKAVGLSAESSVTTSDGKQGVASDSKDGGKQQNEVPASIVSEYRALMELLAFLQKRELELRVKFKAGNSLLAQNQQQIAASETRSRALLNEYPGLSNESLAVPTDTTDPRRNLEMERARSAAISAKVAILEANMKELTEQFARQYAFGAQIDALERRRQIEETEYRSLEVSLKNARIDQTLDPSRMPNITIVEQPTDAVKILDEKTKKLVLGLAAGGLFLGLGLALLIELVLNRKIERPIEIQARLQLPLLLTIPYIRKSVRERALPGSGKSQHRIGDGGAEWAPIDSEKTLEVSSPAAKPFHFIQPFSETIRDRIIFNFNVNNVIHKPKLIAVTAMSEGAGASTIAAGLAKSFSEIKDSKVLLVDLSSFQSANNHMAGGVVPHSLPNALRMAQDSGFRNSHQNLYYANAPFRREGSGPAQFSPLQLHEMMPLMHASEYDYIIFDMPAVAQTSPTLTMAGLMDKVLLVLDAENTTREGLKWGYSELTRGRADVSCIFNKTRSHGPEWLIGSH